MHLSRQAREQALITVDKKFIIKKKKLTDLQDEAKKTFHNELKIRSPSYFIFFVMISCHYLFSN